MMRLPRTPAKFRRSSQSSPDLFPQEHHSLRAIEGDAPPAMLGHMKISSHKIEGKAQAKAADCSVITESRATVFVKIKSKQRKRHL
jgi:hypothetical protein